jgi:hypothetical protein
MKEHKISDKSFPNKHFNLSKPMFKLSELRVVIQADNQGQLLEKSPSCNKLTRHKEV